MHPRSGFRSGGTCERTLVPVFVPREHPNVSSFPVFVPGEHPPKPPFWKTTLLSTPERLGENPNIGNPLTIYRGLSAPPGPKP